MSLTGLIIFFFFFFFFEIGGTEATGQSNIKAPICQLVVKNTLKVNKGLLGHQGQTPKGQAMASLVLVKFKPWHCYTMLG